MSISLIGHDRQIEYINTSKQRGKMAHAYLFHGPAHVGKLTIATVLAQSFFCPDAKKNDIRSVCGECSSCHAIAEMRHPNVVMLDTNHTLVSKKETRKEIPIEDIRELKRIFLFAPVAGEWRLAIINEADKMNEEAASAFLKLLEEPGTNTLFILIAAHKDLLLPTIVSRVSPLGFLTISDAALERMLDAKHIAQDTRKDILALAAGRPGILLQLCESSDIRAADDKKILQDIQNIVHARDMISALRISEQSSQDKDMREKIIHWLAGMLRADLKNEIPGTAALAAAKLTRIDHIAHLIDSTNVNPRLAMDVMFLECMYM